MDFKMIKNEIQKGKSLDEVILENNISIEEILLKVLQENEELKKRIDENEQYMTSVLIDMKTPW